MRLEESSLILTKIKSSLDYKSERETSTGSVLLLYTLSSPISLLQSSLSNPINSSLEWVERTNMVIVHPNQQAEFVARCNLYAIEIDCKRN